MFAFGIPTVISALVVCVNLLQLALFQMLAWTSSVQVPTRGIIICLVCILCSLLGATTAYAIRQKLDDNNQKSGHSYFYYLLMALVACAFGDAFYAYSYFIAALPSGSIEHSYSDFLYNIFAIYIGVASIKRTFYQQNPTLKTPSLYVFIGLTLLLMGVHYVSIVEPLFESDPDIVSNILTISYNVFESVFMAGALMASLRAGTIYEFILWTSVALLGISNIAVNAIDDSLNSSHLRLFDYGWQWGLSGVCIALLGLLLSQQSNKLTTPDSTLNTQVSFRSLRTMTVLFGLGGMLIASYIFWYFKDPDLTFAAHFNSRLTISSELASLFVVWCLSNMFAILMSRRLVAFCQSLYASVLMGDENMNWVLQSRIPSELRPILASLKAVLSRLRLSYELNAQLRTDASIATIAAQVAHDIRSPLMALQAIKTRSHMLDPETQQLIQTATQRIYDITGELLVKFQSEDSNTNNANDRSLNASNDETYSNTLIYPTIEAICTEVKLSAKNNVPITTAYRNTSDVFLSSYLKPKVFKSILANLLHNAVESTIGRPNPAVAVEFEESREHKIILKIKDNGPGFSDEALQHFAQKGFSTKGHQGHGLGLWYSKLQIESFGGSLTLESNSNEGATIQIELPLADAPETNISVIDLRNREIVVIDDEPHTHIIWEQLITEKKQLAQTLHAMFDVADIESKQFYAHHFDTIEAAQQFVRTQKNNSTLDKYVFLVDHEFKNTPKTGGQFIIENGLSNQAVLVTGHTDLQNITTQLGGTKLKILPKVLLPMVQIQVTTDSVSYDLARRSIFSPERFKTSAST